MSEKEKVNVAEEPEVEPEVQELSEIETKAKEMGGYISKEEWIAKGRDPEKWRSPEEFVKRGENIIPILQDRLKKNEEELAAFMRHSDAELERVKKESFELATNDYKKKLAEIKTKKREAFEGMDYEGFEAAENLEKELKAPEPPKAKKEPEYKAPADFVTWQAENPWWNSDEDLTIYAQAISKKVQIEKNLPDGIELYNEVTRRVKETFPHKFKNPKRDEVGSVEGDSPAIKKAGGSTFNDLPKSAKATYTRLAEKFKLQGFDFKKEQYVKEYFAQEK